MTAAQPQPPGRPAARLVATDLDGTLLRSDGTVSPRTRAALARARSHGVETVATTGRPPRLVQALAGELDGTISTAVCANGAIVVDLASGAVLEHSPIPPATAVALVERLRAALPGILFSFELGLDWAREPGYRTTFSPPLAPRHADALVLAREPVTKLLGRHPSLPFAEVLAAAREACGADAVATTAGATVVEISAAGVTKARALGRLCAARGIAPAEVVAFGDAPNDLELLAFAGRPVAVANAQPAVLHAVLAAGGEVTAANDADGVAMVLEQLLD